MKAATPSEVSLHVVVLAILLGVLMGCERFSKEPWESAPLAKDQVETVSLGVQSGLAIDRVRFFSAEMNEPRFFLALVPQTAKPPQEVFILNHGWSDRPEVLLRELKVGRVYSGLLARRAVRPGIVVIPDVRFDNFFRQHSDRFPFPNYLTLVAEELAGVVSKKYGIPFARDRWGMGGFSFGGMVALDVGRRYSGRFGSISVVSGIWDDDWSFWPPHPPAPGQLDGKGRGKQTLAVPGPPPRIFLACGKDDRFFSRMLALHETFNRLGIAHQWSTGPGGHTWKYWSEVLEPMLKFQLGVTSRE